MRRPTSARLLAVIGGVERKIHFFAMDLPHSDAGFVQAYPAETTEAFCDGHVAAFDFFGGVPQSILYDNTRIAVARILGDGTPPADAGVQRAAVALPVRRPVRSAGQGQRQGQGRGSGRVMPAELPGAAAACRQLRGAQRGSAGSVPPSSRRIGCAVTTRRSASGWRATWRRSTICLPTPYDACEKQAGRVSSLSLVRYRGTDYSVPTAYGHREVLVRGYVHEVVISCGAEIIARHVRSYEREDFVFDPLHYLALLEQKIDALDQAAPLAGWELPEAFATLRRLLEARMGKQGKREFVQVLRLMEVFRIDDVAAGVRDAIDRGVIGFDAVKHLVLCRIERRPPRLDMRSIPTCRTPAWL